MLSPLPTAAPLASHPAACAVAPHGPPRSWGPWSTPAAAPGVAETCVNLAPPPLREAAPPRPPEARSARAAALLALAAQDAGWCAAFAAAERVVHAPAAPPSIPQEPAYGTRQLKAPAVAPRPRALAAARGTGDARVAGFEQPAHEVTESRVTEPHPHTQGHTRLVDPDEERAVIDRLKTGDRSAVGVLYRWYGDAVYRSALTRLPTPEAAEDVLKDTFRTALERIGEFEWTGRSIWFWLHRIAVNKAMDLHRRERVRRDAADRADALPFPTPQPLPDPDRTVHVEETARDVQLSLQQLNPRYAEVLQMRLIEDQPREACATAFGLTPAAFDVLFHRACKAFRKVYPP
jgi:RNA polymerase sigma factor (sigma-70 family)